MLTNAARKLGDSPAYPRTADAINYKNRDFDLDGMTLRAAIAMRAMAALITRISIDRVILDGHAGRMPRVACDAADALLEELAKPRKENDGNDC